MLQCWTALNDHVRLLADHLAVVVVRAGQRGETIPQILTQNVALDNQQTVGITYPTANVRFGGRHPELLLFFAELDLGEISICRSCRGEKRRSLEEQAQLLGTRKHFSMYLSGQSDVLFDRDRWNKVW